MGAQRWLPYLGPPILVLAALGMLRSGSLDASAAGASPPPCDSDASLGSSAVRPVPGAWFRLDPRVDPAGELRGQLLEAGRLGKRPSWTLDLPSESFAAGPFGALVLFGADDGAASRLAFLDLVSGCQRGLTTGGDIVRRATLDPDAGHVYEFRVDRRSRADLGVWRLGVGGDAPTRVMPPLGAQPSFGPIFSTELAFGSDGRRLAVQSCGMDACLTRLYDPATSAVALLDAPEQGELIGLAGDVVVTYAACRGLPCPIVAIAPDGGRQTLLSTAGLATIAVSSDGPRLVAESTGEGGRVVVLDLTGRTLGTFSAARALRLQPPSWHALAGLTTPDGFVALAPRGRAADGRGAPAPRFLRLSDGRALGSEEVLR